LGLEGGGRNAFYRSCMGADALDGVRGYDPTTRLLCPALLRCGCRLMRGCNAAAGASDCATMAWILERATKWVITAVLVLMRWSECTGACAWLLC
jgi:hypothetical protein